MSAFTKMINALESGGNVLASLNDILRKVCISLALFTVLTQDLVFNLPQSLYPVPVSGLL